MGKFNVILTGVADPSPEGNEKFIEKFAKSYNTTPAKAKDLIDAKKGVIYTLDDEAKALQAKTFLEKMGGLAKVEPDEPHGLPSDLSLDSNPALADEEPVPLDGDDDSPDLPVPEAPVAEAAEPQPPAPEPPVAEPPPVSVPAFVEQTEAAPVPPEAKPAPAAPAPKENPPAKPAPAAKPKPAAPAAQKKPAAPAPEKKQAAKPAAKPAPKSEPSAPRAPRPRPPVKSAPKQESASGSGPASSAQGKNPLVLAGIGAGALIVVIILVVVGVKVVSKVTGGSDDTAGAIPWPAGTGYLQAPIATPSSPIEENPAKTTVTIVEIDGDTIEARSGGAPAPARFVVPGAEIKNEGNNKESITLKDYNGDPCVLPAGITVRVNKFGKFVPMAYTAMPLRPSRREMELRKPPDMDTVLPLAGPPLDLWSADQARNRRNFDVMKSRSNSLEPYDDNDSPVYYTLKKYPMKKPDLDKFVLAYSCFMSFIFNEGEVDRDAFPANIKRFESIGEEDAANWKNALDKIFGNSPSAALVAWNLVPIDQIFTKNVYDPIKADRYLKRLSQISREDVDRWIAGAPGFTKDIKYDAALTIAGAQYFFPEDKFDRRTFNGLISGTNE